MLVECYNVRWKFWTISTQKLATFTVSAMAS